MFIFARSKNNADLDQHDEKYILRRWLKPMQPEMVMFGLVLTLIFTILHLVIAWSTFITSPKQITITLQDSNIEQHDGLLGGLLLPNFSDESCISRYKSSMYRKPSPFPVSPYLIKKLRSYEEHHKKCGPGTENYRKAVERLKSGKSSKDSDCQYIIWTQCCGVGNRMLSLVSTFLFSLLTNRVMLFEVSDATSDLFCEPFPNSSWLLPYDYEFPIKDSWKFNKDSPESYPFMVINKTINKDVNTSAESLPAYVYLPLENDNYRFVNHIFCENDQKVLEKISWIVLRSDSYFAAALFLMPMYQEELENMFTVKESVFHHLGRYLLQPSNQVWELIERYYETYLANNDERIGLQVRIFPQDNVTFEKMFDQILECSRITNLLPALGPTNHTSSLYDSKKHKAILVVSLFSEYYEKIKSMYYENSTVTGEKVGVYQPSHEQTEKYNLMSHGKALAEIFLLSYCDKIATTSWSTFGYVSYSLAGVRPWIIRSPGWMQGGLDGACVRPGSVEPCSHSSLTLKCDGKVDLNVTKLVPFVRSCEDVPGGLKVFS